MKIKEHFVDIHGKIDRKFNEQFGFHMKNVDFKKLVDYLHLPKDPSSLAVTRIFFGLAMLFDIPDERGGAIMDKRWGNEKMCHFPLLHFVQAIPMPYMGVVYGVMWLGALGIMLGYKYRINATAFTICYWYLLLIDKSFWNNHSYLFGLVGLLLTFTQANCYWSLDAYLDKSKHKNNVPYWNYFILKYQFFILYFMAGMKKGTAEWLTGYSVQNLSEHWVFNPFKLFLTVPQIDLLIVHCFIFVFDLTVSIWMMWAQTRHVAMIFCALFHLMNSRLFSIGMFPWVCLATMPLFYPFNWPKLLRSNILKQYKRIIRHFNIFFKGDKEKSNKNKNEHGNSNNCLENEQNDNNDSVNNADTAFNYVPEAKDEILDDTISYDAKNEIHVPNNDKHKTLTTFFTVLFGISQAILPYSHFITKGYNNWTNGLYGYSWDMMVHTWDTHSVIVKVVDNEKHEEFYVDPYVFTPNDRWTRHGDMVYQYAHCLKRNLLNDNSLYGKEKIISNNISIYIDVWCSMNGRFTQRMFDPKTDLLKVSWSPFEAVSFLMPLLDEALNWRNVLDGLRKEIFSWNKYIDVVFIADFPGYEQEKYIPMELTNITLTVLNGLVAYEEEVTKFQIGQTYKLTSGDTRKVNSGLFHKVMNIGHIPAYYMYTFVNNTQMGSPEERMTPKLPIAKELVRRLRNMVQFGNLVFRSFFQLFFLSVS